VVVSQWLVVGRLSLRNPRLDLYIYLGRTSLPGPKGEGLNLNREGRDARGASAATMPCHPCREVRAGAGRHSPPPSRARGRTLARGSGFEPTRLATRPRQQRRRRIRLHASSERTELRILASRLMMSGAAS
jgi:hypothetical protein